MAFRKVVKKRKVSKRYDALAATPLQASRPFKLRLLASWVRFGPSLLIWTLEDMSDADIIIFTFQE
jgi:hypothetical protein